jgi:hypothetical protein
MPKSPSASLYGNCCVYDPQGTLIFRCDDRLRRWYLGLGLADEVPSGIILRFQPKGPGHSKDPYFLQDFKNRCVGCGSEDSLSHHHVVPYCYRRHFPKDTYQYGRWMYDVLLLCIDCHERYEGAATQLKNEIAAELGVDPQGIPSLNKAEIRMVKLAHALRRHADAMPAPRRLELEVELKRLLGTDVLTEQDLLKAWHLRLRGRTTPAGLLVVQKLTDLDGFARRWRIHFMERMKPRHLPQGWTPDRPIYSES